MSLRPVWVVVTLSLVSVLGVPVTVHGTEPPSALDQPIDQVWPAANTWNDRLEDEYSDFVERLGQAVASRRCRRLDQCLRDPGSNSLYDDATDRNLTLEADCADLPYILRAYFSYKRRLPFGFVSSVSGRGGVVRRGHLDLRYALNIRPEAWRTWRDYRTPREVLSAVGRRVHSGMYRIAPEIENGDFYPVAITRRAVRPGTVFYDPNGHVLVVAQVRRDGVIYLLDGHPDGSLTWKRFGQAFVTGTARLGGGFKNFRPQRWVDGRIVRASNASLPLFDGTAQYDSRRHFINGQRTTYHAWVRFSLSEGNTTVDPVTEFREQVRALCRDVADRVEAVNLAIAAGIHRRPHPGQLPTNIYGTYGEWELYSTPSRDARLKAAFRELRETLVAWPNANVLAPRLRQAWVEETARPECRFSYTNSLGQPVTFTLDTVLDRLFALSFDPYHCPELRWGAPEGSPERATCPDDAIKLSWYRNEQRLRNQIDREYGRPTPLDFGPAVAADVDVRRLLDTLSRTQVALSPEGSRP